MWHTYLPYGWELLDSEDPLDVSERMKFTGHERDSFAGPITSYDVDYMHARYYGPAVRRFWSVDPGPVDPKVPQSWNRYAYVMGNPLRFFDPDGEMTNVEYDDESRTITITSYIEFYGEEASQEVVDRIVNDIETGWSGTYTFGEGEEINVVMTVVAALSQEGGTLAGQNYDQIHLTNAAKVSRITSEGDPVYVGPGESSTLMTNTLRGGVTRGEIRPMDFVSSLRNLWGPSYPGVNVHEWGHALGFNFQRGRFPPTRSTDAMDTAGQPPAAYQLKAYQVNWFKRVAASQRRR